MQVRNKADGRMACGLARRRKVKTQYPQGMSRRRKLIGYRKPKKESEMRHQILQKAK